MNGTRSKGLLLHSDYNTGTTKYFVYCGVQKTDSIPDFIKMIETTFWVYDIGSKMNGNKLAKDKANPIYYLRCQDLKKSPQVQERSRDSTTNEDSWPGQIISAKQIQKELR